MSRMHMCASARSCRLPLSGAGLPCQGGTQQIADPSYCKAVLLPVSLLCCHGRTERIADPSYRDVPCRSAGDGRSCSQRQVVVRYTRPPIQGRWPMGICRKGRAPHAPQAAVGRRSAFSCRGLYTFESGICRTFPDFRLIPRWGSPTGVTIDRLAVCAVRQPSALFICAIALTASVIKRNSTQMVHFPSASLLREGHGRACTSRVGQTVYHCAADTKEQILPKSRSHCKPGALC